jgi:hypothetical protein
MMERPGSTARPLRLESGMIIRASDSELELLGRPNELRAVANALSRLASGESCCFAAEQGAEPSPYDRLLTELEVRATEGLVRVSVAGEKLLATGSPAALKVFASFFEFEDNTPGGYHVHHERYTDHDLIATDSRPLVIRVA